ncbi:hypothetical protein CTI12_AA233550 [Artemisia annua]|uniref:Pre-mRNA-splicing factor 18 n=1 Tax=Artemisia annua TaxID=35608 RepID=A0A2U1NRR9_ARTAN|nr:hypothetical protein CTI12_AA233550 [Artemisia annua]
MMIAVEASGEGVDWGEDEGVVKKEFGTLCDEDKILVFFKKLLIEWNQELDEMSEVEKRTARGKSTFATFKQCARYLDPLFKFCRKKKWRTVLCFYSFFKGHKCVLDIRVNADMFFRVGVPSISVYLTFRGPIELGMGISVIIKIESYSLLDNNAWSKSQLSVLILPFHIPVSVFNLVLPDDIRQALMLVVNCCMKRDYLAAMDHYIRMAIGNAPWPIGVTMVGIHERSAREKIYTNSVAHVMNDETTRKYLQSVKRLMTFCQRRYPTMPSKAVEFNSLANGSDLQALLAEERRNTGGGSQQQEDTLMLMPPPRDD